MIYGAGKPFFGRRINSSNRWRTTSFLPRRCKGIFRDVEFPTACTILNPADFTKIAIHVVSHTFNDVEFELTDGTSDLGNGSYGNTTSLTVTFSMSASFGGVCFESTQTRPVEVRLQQVAFGATPASPGERRVTLQAFSTITYPGSGTSYNPVNWFNYQPTGLATGLKYYLPTDYSGLEVMTNLNTAFGSDPTGFGWACGINGTFEAWTRDEVIA